VFDEIENINTRPEPFEFDPKTAEMAVVAKKL